MELVVALLILCTQSPGAKCPDGSAGLTRAVYEAGVLSAYANVTCIPKQEFLYYTGDISLRGMDLNALQSVEFQAFYAMEGKLTMVGGYRSLERIDAYAFYGAGNAGSTVAIACSSHKVSLTVDPTAFANFKGSRDQTREHKACVITAAAVGTVVGGTCLLIAAIGAVYFRKAIVENIVACCIAIQTFAKQRAELAVAWHQRRRLARGYAEIKHDIVQPEMVPTALCTMEKTQQVEIMSEDVMLTQLLQPLMRQC